MPTNCTNLIRERIVCREDQECLREPEGGDAAASGSLGLGTGKPLGKQAVLRGVLQPAEGAENGPRMLQVLIQY